MELLFFLAHVEMLFFFQAVSNSDAYAYFPPFEAWDDRAGSIWDEIRLGRAFGISRAFGVLLYTSRIGIAGIWISI